jgi:hypothetical protein
VPQSGHDLPRPEAIWIALGIVVWAIAEALEDGRGRRFIEALERRATEHESGPRVVPISSRRTPSRDVRQAGAWLAKVAQELRTATR